MSKQQKLTESKKNPNNTNTDNRIDFEKEFHELFDDMKWNIQGMIDTDGNAIPVPKNSTCITAIIEQKGLEILKKWAKEKGITYIPAPNTRTYPDATLQDGPLDNKIIAVDFKTARRESSNRCSKLTIGSYAGYFVNPDRQLPGCRIPYGDFSEHWIIAFLYDWDDLKDTSEMVSIVEVVVAQKWEIASRSTGTGTTKHIGSICDINRLKSRRGDFNTKEDFGKYWRNYALAHK